MLQRLCLTFAGPVGSSKSPLSYYLSQKLGWPIFNNDAIRTEVIEDLGFLDPTEHLKRRNERLQIMLAKSYHFILDASIDREWGQHIGMLEQYHLTTGIISMDLSREHLERLYRAKNYLDSLQQLDQLMADHQQFLENYGSSVIVSVTDKEFANRCAFVGAAVDDWLQQQEKNQEHG